MLQTGAQRILGPAPMALWLRSVLFGAAYFLCAGAGDFLSAQNTAYVSFWLPSGLYVAVLLLNERRVWPWLLLGALGGNILFDLSHGTHPFIIVFFFYLANTVQALVGAWLVQKFVAHKPTLATLRELVGFLALSAILSTLVGAVIGAATLCWFNFSHSFEESLKVWWGSCAMAVLVFSPFILTWFSPSPLPWRPLQPKKIIEAGLLLALLVLITWYTLIIKGGILSPYKSWMIPFLLWAGLRFGARGATAATLILSLLTTSFTTQFLKGLSPEQIASGEYVTILQIVLATASLVGLIPAIVLGERDQNLARLRESEEHFRNLNEAAFEGISISENGRLVNANDQMLMMFGYQRSEMIGIQIIDLVAPASRETVATAVREGRECKCEYQLLRKDRTLFYAEARVKIVTIGDRTLRMTALRDITERRRNETEREQAIAREQEARVQYTLQLIASQEAERERIAAELHDSLGQNLSVIKNRARMAAQDSGDQTELASHLETIERVAAEAITETRTLAHNLRPLHIAQIGITDSLRGLINEVSKASPIRFESRLENVDSVFKGDSATIFYRLAQEALNNLVKHSQATNAMVTLERDVRSLRLIVSDDGIGFDPAAIGRKRGIGLSNMTERVRMLNGTMVAKSAPGKGTSLVIEVPSGDGDIEEA